MGIPLPRWTLNMVSPHVKWRFSEHVSPEMPAASTWPFLTKPQEPQHCHVTCVMFYLLKVSSGGNISPVSRWRECQRIWGQTFNHYIFIFCFFSLYTFPFCPLPSSVCTPQINSGLYISKVLGSIKLTALIVYKTFWFCSSVTI